jgi:hypothetical protein
MMLTITESLIRTGSLRRWALRLPTRGAVVTLGSYSQARLHAHLDPRGCFAKRADADRRTIEPFWIPDDREKGDDPQRHEGFELEVVEVELTWRIVEADEVSP